jgi:hypothetical protein
MRLDSFIQRPVSLLKIDTEGHDLTIVQTLHPYIKNIEAIIFECSVFWYGESKEECIQKTVDELTFLHKEYNHMYLLSRRGEVQLDIVELDDIPSCVELLYTMPLQVDILVCRDELDLSDPI